MATAEVDAIDWLIAATGCCRNIADLARSSLLELEAEDRDYVIGEKHHEYMRDEYRALGKLWMQVDPERDRSGRLRDMAQHIALGSREDLKKILTLDIPDVQSRFEQEARSRVIENVRRQEQAAFRALLHPTIDEKCLKLYEDGHLRESVLNAVTAVFDMIRARTNLMHDGKDLVGQAFGLERGKLILSDLGTESGVNDQIGFMQIFQGVYTGVRNPKAHSLIHDLDGHKAAQYLVMMSLLARRLDECIERTG